jgi:hypothetical protein
MMGCVRSHAISRLVGANFATYLRVTAPLGARPQRFDNTASTSGLDSSHIVPAK